MTATTTTVGSTMKVWMEADSHDLMRYAEKAWLSFLEKGNDIRNHPNRYHGCIVSYCIDGDFNKEICQVNIWGDEKKVRIRVYDTRKTT